MSRHPRDGRPVTQWGPEGKAPSRSPCRSLASPSHPTPSPRGRPDVQHPWTPVSRPSFGTLPLATEPPGRSDGAPWGRFRRHRSAYIRLGLQTGQGSSRSPRQAQSSPGRCANSPRSVYRTSGRLGLTWQPLGPRRPRSAPGTAAGQLGQVCGAGHAADRRAPLLLNRRTRGSPGELGRGSRVMRAVSATAQGGTGYQKACWGRTGRPPPDPDVGAPTPKTSECSCLKTGL